MAIQLELVEKMMAKSCRDITSDPALWKAFLNTSAWMYKYSFSNQLAIFTQRADATACAGYSVWNNLGRYVKRGSKGIRLVEETAFSDKDIVFEVSDTDSLKAPGKKINLWTATQFHEILASTINQNLGEIDKPINERLAEVIVSNTVDNILEYSDELCEENEVDQDFVIKLEKLRELAINSAVFITLKRCNLDVPNKYLKFDFSGIEDLSDIHNMNRFGEVIASTTNEILSEIEKNIKKEVVKRKEVVYNQEKEQMFEEGRSNHGDNLQTGRGFSNPEFGNITSTRGEYREIRDDEKDIPEGTQASLIFNTLNKRVIEAAPNGYRQGSLGNERQIGSADAGKESGAEQGERSDGLGAASGNDNTSGRGNNHERSDIQISLFPGEDEQKLIIESNEGVAQSTPFLFTPSDTLFNSILHSACNSPRGWFRIYNEFSKRATEDVQTDFIAAQYKGGIGLFYNNEKYSVWADDDGIRISKGLTARFNSNSFYADWQTVITHIGKMLESGDYITNDEQEYAQNLEFNELAESLTYFYRDLTDVAKDDGFLASIKKVHKGSVSDTKQDVEQLLHNADSLIILQQEMKEIFASNDDNKLLRFKSNSPISIYNGLLDISVERKRFKSNGNIAVPPRKFITNDEIDEDLLSGSGFAGGRRRIFEYLTKSYNTDEKSNFLKHEYGTGGHSGPDIICQDHNAKGITYKAAGCESVILSWNEVLKRVEALIQRGIYYQKSGFEIEEELEEANLDNDNINVMEKSFATEEEIKNSIENSDYTIVNEQLGVGTASEKLKTNLNAIRILNRIENEERNATNEEKDILAAYVGWGGLADAFDESKNLYSAELKDLLSGDEYKSAMGSVLNSHYTSPVIIHSMYDALENLGFKGGNILEPSCGIGNFLGVMPHDMRSGSNVHAVELDSISGRIAKVLYPNAKIKITGYENTDFPDNSFDVAIGNVPFGNYTINDKKYNNHGFKIHDYFFAKTLDQIRPGGVIAFITSKGTLDKKSNNVRRYLAERADLLGAIRLPNTAFKANAGTDVTSDIIFLQKKERPTILTEDPEWINIATDEMGKAYNEYFINHPEMILGEMKEVSGPFGMELTCSLENPSELKSRLESAITNIKGAIPEVEFDDIEDSVEENEVIPADVNSPNYCYSLVDDKIYYRENSIMRPVLVNLTAQERIKALIEIRICTKTLIQMQLEDYSNDTIIRQQHLLNDLYDNFLKKYGVINSKANALAFRDDSGYPLICSLENLDDDGNLKSKADIFSKRTIKASEVITHVELASEALALSLAYKGRIDMDYIVSLTQKTKEEIVTELRGVIYREPNIEKPENEKYVTASEYLSGSIRSKIAAAKLLCGEYPEYNYNIAQLERVMPKALDASEIDVRLGTTWIPIEYYKDFMQEIFETPRWMINHGSIDIRYLELTGNWNIQGKSVDSGNVKANVTYGTSRASGYRILEDSLNLRSVQITDVVVDAEGKEKRVVNAKETTLAVQKQELLKEKFKEWIWEKPERREALCNIYNEKFNSDVAREYDGEHLIFPGMNSAIALKEHQKRAVARQLYGGNTLLAHCVGAGKTFEMATAIMEKKRLGLCNKAMLVVPNHLTGQWASEFMQLYPTANILAVTKKDFQPMNRKKFCTRIAMGDYDAVIIGHSQFEMIPLSKERQELFLQTQIDDITREIDEVKARNGERFTVKQLVKMQKDLKGKLEKLNDGSKKDNAITFEELGVDFLCVDEAHGFKNLALQTKMRNVAGIQTTGANKSYDMFAKCRYLDEITGGKGITFATGTPISNSMSELYTMQKYLQYNVLQRNGLLTFDSWASTFGDTQTVYELAPEGNGYRQKTRFSKFFNIPELMSMFKEVADIQTADMLDLPVPKAEYETVTLKPSERQKEMIRALSERAENVRKGIVDPTEDNMLKITTDGRKIALDERLVSFEKDEIQEDIAEIHQSKVDACVDRCVKLYNETKAKGSAQLIFSDLATPNKDGRFTVYDDIKRKLISAGVDEKEIAFIHDANTEKRKEDLFKSVRQGKVKFLLGSTSKMGAGMNVQDKLIALHHIDVPWKPSDIEQREGRIVRQGNENDKVNIYRYVTENTFDAYSWQLIENKQKFIGQIMTSKSPVRSCNDIDEVALSYAEIKALATGNPYIKEKMELDNDVDRLKVMKSNYLSEHYKLQDALLKRYPIELLNTNNRIIGIDKDVEHLKHNPVVDADNFNITIHGHVIQEKRDAGAIILKEARENELSDKFKEVGEYLGFTISVKYSPFDGNLIKISNNASYVIEAGSDSIGVITRLNNLLNSLPSRLDSAKQKLENINNQVVNAEEELKKPFSREAELKVKQERLTELEQLLAKDEEKEKEGDAISIEPCGNEQFDIEQDSEIEY